MIKPHTKGVAVLILFFVMVLAAAFYFNRPFYPLAITGESSVGTWLSGVLLVASATLSLIIGMRQKSLVWFMITAFFLILAMDERFMFHEQLKERLIFSFHPVITSRWIYELPVLLASCVGMFISFLLWKQFSTTHRVLLCIAMALGLVSVTVDVLAAGVIVEECAKLLAELAIACALVRQVEV